MSNPATPAVPPFNQFQNFYPTGVNPYTLDPAQILAAMQNTNLTSNIYDGTNKTIFAVSDTQRQLTSELAGVTKDINDSTAKLVGTVETHSLGLRDAIERGNAGISSAVERNGANGMNTTERVAGQLSTAVERNGGNILTAIEKVAGDGRLTTTVVDAASRQAANDSARDILAAVERNGSASVGASKDSYNGLLASIERNSGENRMTTVTADSASQARLADVRRDITSNLSALEGEILTSANKNHGDLITAVGNSAWETRQNQSNHYASLLSEGQKSAAANALQSAQYYSSLLLESQKTAALIANKQDNHYASQMLESQKLAHISDNKADGHFAAMLSKQDNHFAALLLEQQKSKEVITMQLQDAKYEALKNKCDLSKELAECCCEIKMKVDQRGQDVINTVDTLDRNRLRDEVNTITNENSILRILELADRDYGRGYGRRHRHRSRSPRSRSSSRGR